MNKKFWKNKKVLITGYEGFLGSHLTAELLGAGAKIYGLDILTRREKTILSKRDLAKIVITKGSVENISLVRKIIEQNKIEIIFHLAAKSLVGDCLRQPVKGFSTNIKGTWNILEAARGKAYIKAIVIASSDKAYGSHKKLPYRENYSLLGVNPYDASKSCADLISTSYFHTYNLPVAITRCGNVYGPGDFNFSRLLPDLMRSIIGNKSLIIRSDGRFTRDYVYVSDIVYGYILLAQKINKHKLSGQAFNLSDGNPMSVLKLVREVYKMFNKQPDYKILSQAEYEIKHQYLSSKKARRVLGWKPKVSFNQGIKKTFDWYKDYLDK